MDGAYLWRGAGDVRVKTNILLVSRDAVAVETIGAILAGLNPEEMPVIQEFVKRDLGEGDPDKIEILGTSFEDLQDSFKSARKNLEERAARKILGEVNPRKDTVASIVKRRGYSKTRVTKALRHLGYTVHKDGTFD